MGLAKRFMTSSTLSLLPVWHLRRSILPETPTKPCHWLWEMAISKSTDEQSQKPLRNSAMTELSRNDEKQLASKLWTSKAPIACKASQGTSGCKTSWNEKRNVANARDVFVDQDCKILKHLTLLTSAHSLVRHLTSLDSIFTSATVDYSTGFIIFHDSTNEKRTKSVMYILVIRVSLSSCSILQTSCRYTNSSSRSSISLHLVEAKKIWKNGVEVSKLIWQLSLYSPTEYH